MRTTLIAAFVTCALVGSAWAEYRPGSGAPTPPNTPFGSTRYVPPVNVPPPRSYPEPSPSLPQRQQAPASPEVLGPTDSGGGVSYGSGYDRLDPRQRPSRP